MLQTVPTQIDPQLINDAEERAITEWQQLYPDRWLLLEVTQEDEGDACNEEGNSVYGYWNHDAHDSIQERCIPERESQHLPVVGDRARRKR